ncbi:glucosyltransferase Alg8 [Histoplasma capsulatum G186AR]|uniref:Glucosyltransferase Alg8 n=1 Tax=Ajellomyces capsulatus TaxID=5037 RepID=A0A8H7YJK7_AJECA|nr:glucosyltransferase Alg8 [Histoplasma capsulatum]QSS68476.1 glucosyltransferase Alg8 [Histoplasma capsulatum G186AR]
MLCHCAGVCSCICTSSIYPIGGSGEQTARACSRALHPPIPRPSHHRPHPFPIQRIPLRASDPLARPGPQAIHPPLQRDHICHPPLPEAYLPLSLTGVFRLPPPGLLPAPQVAVDLPSQIRQHFQAGRRGVGRFWRCVWTLFLLGSAGPAEGPTVSVLAWAVPCVLGAECMGYVLVRGSGAYFSRTTSWPQS